jgi:hypothetical protein
MEVRVEVFSDRMEVAAGGKSATVRPSVPYAGQRILVGSFQPAVDCLRQALEAIGASGALKRKPALQIQAMEMNEGGLSEVEEQCLREVGLTVGARSVEVR